MIIGMALFTLYTTYAMTRKLGLQGWEFFVPLYDVWKLAEIATGKAKKALWLLLIFVPIVGSFIALVFLIIWYIKFAKKLAAAYNRSAVGIFFLGNIFLAGSIFKDAPNCDDPINQFVAKLFKIEAKAE